MEGPLDLFKVVRYYDGHYDSELFPAAMITKDAIHFTCFLTGSVLMMTGIRYTKQIQDVCMPVLIELPLL